MWEDKETTAPDPSVAPDGEQPSALARTDSITDIEETHKQFGKIQIMTMPELMETRFRVRPAEVTVLAPDRLSVTIHEGRNRQVRRLCALAGLRVLRLVRVAEGELRLGTLAPRRWRELTDEEVAYLKSHL